MINATIIKKLIKPWLLQLLVLWAIINIYDTVYFVYRTYLWDQTAKYDPLLNEILARFVHHNLHQNMIWYMALVTLLSEINYQYIFKKYNWYAFTAGVITSGIVAVVLISLFRNNRHGLNLLEPFSVIAGYCFGYTLLREFFHHRLYSFKIRASRSENELQALKQQLNPHFLFNTLNYVYGTALQEGAPRTAEAIDIMAGMMRYTVTGMQETFTSLNAEIGFIEQYVQLQRLRLPAANAQLVKITIAPTDQPLMIAPLILMPFIENAFKYGVNNDEQMPVSISINVKGTTLDLQVVNSIVNNQADVPGTNSGLTLSRQRLSLLYPDKHELTVSAKERQFEVRLKLQLQ